MGKFLKVNEGEKIYLREFLILNRVFEEYRKCKKIKNKVNLNSIKNIVEVLEYDRYLKYKNEMYVYSIIKRFYKMLNFYYLKKRFC